MVAVVVFFVIHWQLSVFFQSFFLHRYGAHRQFTMSRSWERFFHALTWVVQGPSYLNPRAYAVMHRMHHAYSDTPGDPHSPVQEPNFLKMMWKTKVRYSAIKTHQVRVEPRFDGGYPEWELFDEKLSGWPVSIAWGALYTLVYVAFATHWWMFLLLPFHYVLGPVHGAIVNWAGHKVGYRNYASDDQSRNTLVVDVLTMGELFQNNHHKWGQSPNFAVRAFELDPAYQIMRMLDAVGVIDMSKAQKARWEKAKKAAVVAPGSLPVLRGASPLEGE